MKEMVYTNERKCEILDKGIYKGYTYYIISYGTHPCGYVKLNDTSLFDNYEYEWDIPIECHGGITFFGEFHEERVRLMSEIERGIYVGWDYVQSCDACGLYRGGKRHTTEEIHDEVIKVIEQIIEIETEKRTNKEELKEDVVAFCPYCGESGLIQDREDKSLYMCPNCGRTIVIS